jgi:hypothetical protein
MMSPDKISYSQVDITEHFGDNLSLSPSDWVQTTPLNIGHPNPESCGLPPVGATDEEVYSIAEFLSGIRESLFNIPTDGVYCPICHSASIDLSLLRSPCPKCNRPLLKFGWD